MAGPRQPIELVVANGRKHLTKEEISSRRASEVQPCADAIKPPSYLPKAQRARFKVLAGQLAKLKIMGETDVDALARYVVAEELYEQVTKRVLTALSESEDAYEIDLLSKSQDRYFRQANAAARELGLTISSRCKLVVPVKEDEPKPNKFARFGGDRRGQA